MSLNQNLNKYPLETREDSTKTKCDKLRGMGTSRLYFLFVSVLLLAHTYFGDFSFFFLLAVNLYPAHVFWHPSPQKSSSRQISGIPLSLAKYCKCS